MLCMETWPVQKCSLTCSKTGINTRFNINAIQATAQMAVDKEAVGLSRVHMYESIVYPAI